GQRFTGRLDLEESHAADAALDQRETTAMLVAQRERPQRAAPTGETAIEPANGKRGFPARAHALDGESSGTFAFAAAASGRAGRAKSLAAIGRAIVAPPSTRSPS